MILPSILSTNHLHLHEQLKKLVGVAPMLHIDIGDGVFIPNVSFGPKYIKEIYDEFDFDLDVHYMVKDPQRFIKLFEDIPQKWISYHAETGIHPHSLDIPQGSKIGVAVNPDTHNISQEILSSIDFLIIMGVYPGFGGASFVESTFDKVKLFHSTRLEANYNYDIVVDGGVTQSNITKLKSCGADHFVVGAGIFKHDPREAYLKMIKMCDNNDGY